MGTCGPVSLGTSVDRALAFSKGVGRGNGVFITCSLLVWLRVLPPLVLAQMQPLALGGSGGLADCTQRLWLGPDSLCHPHWTRPGGLAGPWNVALVKPFPQSSLSWCLWSCHPSPAALDRPFLLRPVTTFTVLTTDS